MNHKCTIGEETSPQLKIKWYQKYTLVYADNPLRFSYFRSSATVLEEQRRHLKISRYTIHPLSKFRALYEIYLIFLYASVLITKPVDAGFLKYRDCVSLPSYRFYNVFTDLLCWIDIFLNFWTGYKVKHVDSIELRAWKIARNYIFSVYFLFDVMSSIPKCVVYGVMINFELMWMLKITGLVSILSMLKAVRIISLVKCTWRTASYFQFSSKGLIFLLCTIFGSLMIVHWLACLQFIIPRLFRRHFAAKEERISWFFAKDLYGGTLYSAQRLMIRYNHCLMKSSAYILAIRMSFYQMDLPEEYVLAIVTYFIGKILIGFIWIILAVAILNSRIMELKFAEVMNQTEEYLGQRNVPLNLRKRIIQYFHFKYRGKYFHEELITSLLSETLKKETNVHACKSLIENVPLFESMTPTEVAEVVNCLIPEIHLPNDIIVHAGTHGDAMYFLASGTVAAYTRSGREICHLQDGAYFGEIALVLKRQLRSVTIVALETSHVYRLKKKDLQKYLLANKVVMTQILRNAEKRLKETVKLEEEYKEELLEKSFRLK